MLLKKKWGKMTSFMGLASIATLTVSAQAFADTGDGSSGGSSTGLVALGSALAISLATFAAATAQGKTASAALEGIARNPQSRDQVFLPMILGLVFIEFQALLGFIIAILWYNK